MLQYLVNRNYYVYLSSSSTDMYTYIICTGSLDNEICLAIMVYLQVNALIARELSGFTCTSSLTTGPANNEREISIPHEAASNALLVNSCR